MPDAPLALMWRVLLVAFLIVHGLIHLGVWVTPKPSTKPPPFDPAHSWLFGTARPLAVTLAWVSAIVLAAAGIALWTHASWWRDAAVAGLAISFGMILVFFNPWYIPIELVNAGLIVAIAWLHWPSRV